jgi:hypothetical protein
MSPSGGVGVVCVNLKPCKHASPKIGGTMLLFATALHRMTVGGHPHRLSHRIGRILKHTPYWPFAMPASNARSNAALPVRMT